MPEISCPKCDADMEMPDDPTCEGEYRRMTCSVCGWEFAAVCEVEYIVEWVVCTYDDEADE